MQYNKYSTNSILLHAIMSVGLVSNPTLQFPQLVPLGRHQSLRRAAPLFMHCILLICHLHHCSSMGPSKRSSTSYPLVAFVHISTIEFCLILVLSWWQLGLAMNYPYATVIIIGLGHAPTMSIYIPPLPLTYPIVYTRHLCTTTPSCTIDIHLIYARSRVHHQRTPLARLSHCPSP